MKLVIFLLPLFLISFVSSDVTRGSNLFATTLYKTLAKENENEAFSPFSLHTLLALAYEGSTGLTENSLKTALTLPSKLDTATSYKGLLTKLARKSVVVFNVANKMYAKTGYTFTKSFRDIAVNDFLAETASINFENGTAAANEINGWVSTKTNGKIPRLVSRDDFNRDTRTILLNAFYFKGVWDDTFNTKDTKTQPFYVNDKETVNCQMMHKESFFSYSINQKLDAQLLQLMFSDNRFSLVVILPNSKTGITRLEESLKNVDIEDLATTFTGGVVDVSLPRFKIESSYKLREILSKAGLAQIFSDSAEFPNILNEEPQLKVSEVFHKVTIEINEKGGEASAASGLVGLMTSLGAPPPRITFNADHPFIFLLTAKVERSYSNFSRDLVILLMGKVMTVEEAVKE